MTTRGGLFLKYVVLFVILVSGTLVTSGLVEIYFSYQENKAALVRVQREKAVTAAARIEQFVREVERQIGWIANSPWGPRGVSVEQRRFDSLRLLRQVPAITEVSHLDPTGHEKLRVSRLAMDVVGSNADLSLEPKFLEASWAIRVRWSKSMGSLRTYRASARALAIAAKARSSSDGF